MRDRQPRYYQGNTRAGLVEPGSKVRVYPSAPRGKSEGRAYTATIYKIKKTPQGENPAVIVDIHSGKRHGPRERRSIGGGTAVHILEAPSPRTGSMQKHRDVVAQMLRDQNLPQVEIIPGQ